MGTKIFHIDVNSAYLSWEAAYRLQHGETLDLRTIPSVVGGDAKKRHGIVLAKSIPAKKLGVQTGESLYTAFKKCPQLVSVPPHYSRYIAASDAMIQAIEPYSIAIQRFSIDEVFCEINRRQNDFEALAHRIKDAIREELGFTVNVGIGDNKLLAKVASDFTKPDRVHTLYTEDIPSKMWPLPVGDLFMVGRRTEKKLKGRGIYTIGDLARMDRSYIYQWLKKPGITIWEYANGIENSRVRTDPSPPKSIGNSTTTAFDIISYNEASQVILGLCEMVGMRLRANRSLTSLISVSFRDQDFNSYGCERKIYTATDSTSKIFQVALTLFDRLWNRVPLRQFGVCVRALSPNTQCQLSFFDPYEEKDSRIGVCLDNIRKRYGNDAVQRATFLHSGIRPVIGGVIQEETYPMMSSIL